MEKISLEELIKEFQTAKNNVQWLLNNLDGSVDFHGLEYWAGRVERLHTLIKNSL